MTGNGRLWRLVGIGVTLLTFGAALPAHAVTTVNVTVTAKSYEIGWGGTAPSVTSPKSVVYDVDPYGAGIGPVSCSVSNDYTNAKPAGASASFPVTCNVSSATTSDGDFVYSITTVDGAITVVDGLHVGVTVTAKSAEMGVNGTTPNLSSPASIRYDNSTGPGIGSVSCVLPDNFLASQAGSYTVSCPLASSIPVDGYIYDVTTVDGTLLVSALLTVNVVVTAKSATVGVNGTAPNVSSPQSITYDNNTGPGIDPVSCSAPTLNMAVAYDYPVVCDITNSSVTTGGYKYVVSKVDGTVSVVASIAVNVTVTAKSFTIGVGGTPPSYSSPLRIVYSDTTGPGIGTVACSSPNLNTLVAASYPVICTGPLTNPYTPTGYGYVYSITYVAGSIDVVDNVAVNVTVTGKSFTIGLGGTPPSYSSPLSVTYSDSTGPGIGSVTCSSSSLDANSLGSYAVDCTGLTSGSTVQGYTYNITYVPGYITVVSSIPVEVTVSPKSYTIAIGGTPPSVGSAKSIVYSDTTGPGIGSVTCQVTGLNVNQVGSYPVTCVGEPSPYKIQGYVYTITYDTGYITVVPTLSVNVTVTGKTAAMSVGGTAPNVSTPASVVYSDNTGPGIGSVSCAVQNLDPTTPGSYPVICSGAKSPYTNLGYVYYISYNPGKVLVMKEGDVNNPAAIPVTVTAIDSTAYAGLGLPPFEFRVSEASVLTTLPTCAAYDGITKLTNADTEGTFTIKCSGANASSAYTITYVDAKLTVLPDDGTHSGPAPLATYDKPVEQRVPNTANIMVRAQMYTADGRLLTVIVKVPMGASSAPMKLRLSPGRALPDLIGYTSLRLVAVDAAGKEITSFSKPIEVIIPVGAQTAIPAWSQEGKVWTAIPELTSTTLASTAADGYYVSADESFHILTTHFTTFALQQMQPTVTLKTKVKAASQAINQLVPLVVRGGAGDGSVRYQSLTKTLCAFPNGAVPKLKTKKVGRCVVIVRKAGDRQFFDAESAPLLLLIKKTPSAAVTAEQLSAVETIGTGAWRAIKSVPSVQLLFGQSKTKPLNTAMGSAATKVLTVKQGLPLNVTLTGFTKGAIVSPMVIAPNGVASYLANATATAKGGVVFQTFKFSKPGTYRLLVRSSTSNAARLLTLRVV